MMIVDEVQSAEWAGPVRCSRSSTPECILTLCASQKGIGSGMPIGATVAKADIMSWHKGAHASTFGGNPVCIASALKTIELLENGLVENARIVGDYLKAGLEKLQEKYVHRRRPWTGYDAGR